MKSFLTVCSVFALAFLTQSADAQCRHSRSLGSQWTVHQPSTSYVGHYSQQMRVPSYYYYPTMTTPTIYWSPQYRSTPQPSYPQSQPSYPITGRTPPSGQHFTPPTATPPYSSGRSIGRTPSDTTTRFGGFGTAGSSQDSSEAIIDGKIVTFRNGRIVSSRPYRGR